MAIKYIFFIIGSYLLGSANTFLHFGLGAWARSASVRHL